ncbi:hypothetical protein SAMN04488548_11422, partial [Gordonia westfalica]
MGRREGVRRSARPPVRRRRDKGNTVHIPGVVAPAIKDYKANNRTTSADAITDTGVDLLIDQEKNFDFKVDDIDAAQSAGSLAPYTDA